MKKECWTPWRVFDLETKEEQVAIKNQSVYIKQIDG